MLNNNVRDSMSNRFQSVNDLCQNVKEIIEFWFLPSKLDFNLDTVAPLSILFTTTISDLVTLITFTTHYYTSLVQSYNLAISFTKNDNINDLLHDNLIPETCEITDRVVALQNIAKHVLNIGLTDASSVEEYIRLLKPDKQVFIIIWLFEMGFIYQKISEGRQV